MHKATRNFGWILAGLLLTLLPAAAQVTVGENVNLNLAGDVAMGYNGAYGDTFQSNHGLTAGGNGHLTGSYYNPKFLSFNLQPYYNRSQNNSSYQSISNSSGFTGGVELFSGSHFPGSVSYSRLYQGDGQFGIPGLTGYTNHGNGQSFSIGWGAFVPHLPSLSFTYATNSSQSDVYGANSSSDSHTRNFTVQSSYSLKKFRLSGMFMHQGLEGKFPGIIIAEPDHFSHNAVNSYYLQASHALPMRGEWFMGWTHSSYSGDYESGNTNGSNSGRVNLLNSGVVVNPTQRLTLSASTVYNSNVFGTLQQGILQAGGDVSSQILNASSKAVTVNTAGYYRLTSHITLNGQVIHLNQFYNDKTIGVTQYGGGVNFNYAGKLLGALNFSAGLVDTATEQGNTGAALVGNVNFARKFGRWDLGGSFSYQQQVQTLLATYTTSTMYYSGSVRRPLFYGIRWGGIAHGSHSGFTRTSGTTNHAEGVTTNLAWGRYMVNGTYSQSSGMSILTPQGLVVVPGGVPVEVIPEQIIYSGTSVGGGAAISLKRFVLSANYAKAHSESIGSAVASRFDNHLINARLQYRLRKLYLNGGFTRFAQGISTAGLPSQVNTYYVGVSRWFNVF